MAHDTDDLLAEIDRFLEKTGITQTTFGILALNDSAFVTRLRAGRTITLRTVVKIRAFMAEYRARGGASPRSAEAAE